MYINRLSKICISLVIGGLGIGLVGRRFLMRRRKHQMQNREKWIQESTIK